MSVYEIYSLPEFDLIHKRSVPKDFHFLNITEFPFLKSVSECQCFMSLHKEIIVLQRAHATKPLWLDNFKPTCPRLLTDHRKNLSCVYVLLRFLALHSVYLSSFLCIYETLKNLHKHL